MTQNVLRNIMALCYNMTPTTITMSRHHHHHHRQQQQQSLSTAFPALLSSDPRSRFVIMIASRAAAGAVCSQQRHSISR